jgi:hypothetical protein
MKKILIGTALAVGLSTAAHATDITVTGYDTPDTQAFGTGEVLGYSYYDGPITLHVAGGADIVVYCADISHELQAAVYETGALTQNGLGGLISQSLSNRIGNIAELGFASNDGLFQSAAQLAIWSLEYNVTPTFYNATVQSDFATLLGDVFANNGAYASALIPTDGWPTNLSASQQMVTGMTAVPEPSTWAMMLIGFAGLAYAATRQTKQARLAA